MKRKNQATQGKRGRKFLGAVDSQQALNTLFRTVKGIDKGLRVAQLFRRPGAGSQTKTKRKKKKHSSWSRVDGIKFATIGTSYKPTKLSKIVKSLTQPCMTKETKHGVVRAAIGQQISENIDSVRSVDLNLTFVQANNGTPPANFNKSLQMYLNGWNLEVELGNAGPTTIEGELYFYLDKNTGAATDPLTTWANAVIDSEGVATPPIITPQLLWEKPTSYKGFNLNYWTKKLTFMLTPGERCKMNVFFKPRRLIDTQYMDDFAAIRGITGGVFIVHRGTIVTTKQGTADDQTIAPTKLLYIVKKSTTGQVIAKNPRRIVQLGTALTQSGAFWQIDEDNGQPEDATAVASFA